MTNRANILNELRELSPLLASISPGNIYHVPDGYFEGLAAEVLHLALTNKEEELSFVSNLPQPNPDVPQGYFDNLSSQIMARIKANEAKQEDDELKSATTLLSGISKNMPYSVPDGYFDDLNGCIMSSVKQQDAKEELHTLAPVLAGITNKMPYSVPEGYFDQLGGEICSSIRIQDINTADEPSSILAGIGNNMPYKLPHRYFEGLANRITALVTEHKAPNTVGRVVAFRQRKTWLRIAAAAIITGFMATSAFFIIRNNNKVEAGAQLAMFSLQTVSPFTEPEILIDKASDQAISNYLEENKDMVASSIDNNTSSAPINFEEEDIQDILSTVPDEALKEYLSENEASEESGIN
jgi:hypothetical protein